MVDPDRIYEYEQQQRNKYKYEMNQIRYSDLSEEDKAHRMYILERDYLEKTRKRRHYHETYNNVEFSNGCGCLITLCFLSLSTIFAGVGMAKTVSNVPDVKQPQSINQPCEKPTLVSKNKVISPKDLGSEHLKN